MHRIAIIRYNISVDFIKEYPDILQHAVLAFIYLLYMSFNYYLNIKLKLNIL